MVAILSVAHSNHRRCIETLQHLQPPLPTTWPVITEAHYLLRKNPVALNALFTALKQKLFSVEELSPKAIPWLEEFLGQYSDMHPQLADASLMYLAEKKQLETIFTLDNRDFSIYRFSDKKAPHIIPN